MRILAIETSCDETACSLVEVGKLRPKVITNAVASQIVTHSATGGVIPDVAARMHTEKMTEVLERATDYGRLTYDAIAVTAGPGLVGSLLIGLAAAKTIASTTSKPFLAINHLEGHIYSAWLTSSVPELPVLVLMVSGKHSELVYMPEHLKYQLLGSTRDDAAGEAFDKVARLLDLPYPGGPKIAELAEQGNENAFELPIALKEIDNLEFSFSGIKGSVYHLVSGLPQPLTKRIKADIAASFQKTVTNTLIRKTCQALKQHPEVKTVILVGGVAANRHLRTHLEQAVHQTNRECRFVVPEFKYCTDNAAMIGAAASFRSLHGQPDNWYDTAADPNLQL